MIKYIKKIIPTTVKLWLRKGIKLYLFFSKKYYCPLCGYSSDELEPIGIDSSVLREKEVIGAGRRDGGCYNCEANDREKLIFTYLNRNLDVFHKPKDYKILHLAPEHGISKALLNIGFDNYICGDLFTEGYSYPEYVQNMNVLNIPYEDNYFDLIICNHLLEHVPDDKKAMQELYRVLNNGGKAILQVPISKNTNETFEDFSITDPKERQNVFGQFDHVRIYGQDYTKRLKSVGFNMERINISKKYKKYGLVMDEDIFIGIK